VRLLLIDEAARVSDEIYAAVRPMLAVHLRSGASAFVECTGLEVARQPASVMGITGMAPARRRLCKQLG
jgi:hypothetical protein